MRTNRSFFDEVNKDFNMNSKMPNPFKWVIVFMIVMFIGAAVWNYSMYQDCRADGHKAYQCSAMLSGDRHYIAVDQM